METNLMVKVENVNGILVTTSNRVANELGVEHKNLTRKIENYIEKFGSSGLSHEFYIESTYENRGKQYKNYLITEKGIAQIIGGYSSAVSMAFDLNVSYINEFERMRKIIREEIKPVKKLEERSNTEILKDNGLALNELLTGMGLNIPKELIVATAIETTKRETGYDFNEVKLLINKQDEESYHTKSEICKRVGIKANKVNLVLAILGLQINGDSTVQPWILTELGKEYAVERAFTKNGHQGYEIKLKSNAEDYIKENINKIPVEWLK